MRASSARCLPPSESVGTEMAGAFSGIVGHARQLTVLGQAMEHDAVAPAWLFHGPAGVGFRLPSVPDGREAFRRIGRFGY